MADIGFEETEEILAEIEGKVGKVYGTAVKESKEKLENFMRKFDAEDLKKKAEVKAGKLTEEAYNKWRLGKMASGKRYQAMLDTLAADLTNADKIAMSVVGDYMPEVYAINRNFAAFEVEKGSMMDTSFTLYDRQTVEHLIRWQDLQLPKPKVDIPKDKRWNKRHIREQITQGILQGESIPDIAKRLQKVTDMDKSAAIRNARTATTGAQNVGRTDSYKRAETMGIKMKQEWLATLDGRTRHSHRQLDGKKIKVGGVFPNGCRYPGDPLGPPEEVYNCRCTLVAALDSLDQSDAPRISKLGNMSYEEWKKGKLKEKKKLDGVKKEYYNKKKLKDYKPVIDIEGLSERQINNAWKDICTPLTDEEYQTTRVYVQTSNSFRINKIFRMDGDKNTPIEQLFDSSTAKKLRDFDKIIEKDSLKKDSLLARLVGDTYSEATLGIPNGKLSDVIANFETDAVQAALNKVIGTKVTEYGYMSTAGAVSSDFTAFGHRSVMLRFHASEGTKALIINPSELEVVLGRNTQYTIVGFGKESFIDDWGDKVDRLIVNCVLD